MKKTSKLLLSLLLALVFVFQLAAPMASAAPANGVEVSDSVYLNYRLTAEVAKTEGEGTEFAQINGEDEDSKLGGTCEVTLGDEAVSRDGASAFLSSVLNGKDIGIEVPSGYYVSALCLCADGSEASAVDLLEYATADASSANLTLTSDALTVTEDETRYLNSERVTGDANTAPSFVLDIRLSKIDPDAPIKVTDGSGNELSSTQAPEAAAPEAHQHFAGWKLTYENGSSVLVDAGAAIAPYANCKLEAVFENNVYPVTVSANSPTIELGQTAEFTASVESAELSDLSITDPEFTLKDKDENTVSQDALTAGTYTLLVSGGRIMSGGEDITAYCNISYVPGTLTVNAAQADPAPTPIAITITANPPIPDGDGSTFKADGYTVTPADALIDGDKIQEGSVTLTVSKDAEGKWVCTPSGAVITDAADAEVAENKYAITYVAGSTEPIAVQADPIEITITAKPPKFDVEKNEYWEDGCTSEGLLPDDKLSVTYDIKVENGKCTSTPKTVTITRTVDGAETDVTASYAITPVSSASIDLPTLTIKANTPKYDSANKKFVEDGFVQIPATLDSGDTVASVAYTIGADNKCTPSGAVIKNADNKDVTNKYFITYEPSEAGVIPADPTRGTLTITAKSREWTYDGKAHTCTDYEVSGLVDGDTVKSVTFKSTSTITDAGTQKNEIDTVIIKDKDGNDVTAQYTLDSKPGELKVNKRSITMSVGNVNITNGSTFTISSSTVKVTLSGDGLAENQKLSVTCKIYQNGKALDSAKDEGTYELRITGYEFKDAGGNTVSKDNYNVTTNNGTLTIKKDAKNLPLTITAKDGTWTYDGKAHTCTDYEVSGLVDGDTVKSVTFKSTSTITDAGTAKNEIDKVVIVDKNGNAVDSGKYKVSLAAGTLTVKKYPLTIKAESASKTYDGKALENKNVTAGKLASTDHKLSVSYTVYNSKGNKVNSPIEVGTYTKKITDYKIMSGSVDVTKNYDVKTEDGTLTIKSSDKNNSNSPKTGDESNLGLWIGLLAFSAVVVLAVVVFIVIKNKKKNSETYDDYEDTDDNDGSSDDNQ